MEFQPQDVHAFADAFGVLKYDSGAIRRPHLQAGGFIWSDETPDMNARNDYPVPITRFMLALISYRTTLMRKVPHAPFTPYWNALHECCPTWPGFRSERYIPSLIRELDYELNAELDKLERMLKICDRRRARETNGRSHIADPDGNGNAK
jgi:hypothetical protein